MNFNEQTIYTFRATKLLVDLMELIEVVSWKLLKVAQFRKLLNSSI